MENQIISLLANKVVSELKNIYNNLKILSYYNSDFGNYELAIEDSEVSESDEFKAMLQKLLEKEIYEKNLYLYAYFTENFNEIEKALAVDKTVYTHKETFNTEDCVEGIISYVEKLYTEKPGSRLELQIPVGPNQTVIVEKRTVVEDLEEEKTNIKGVINDERNAHELKFINNWFHVTNK